MNKRRNLLFNEVIGEIFHYIEHNNMKTGDKFPSERELAGLIGINRSTLREVLKTLEALRVIEIRHGSGIFLKDERKESSFESMVFKLFSIEGLDFKEYNDVLEVRELIEPPALVLAVDRITKNELEKIEEILKDTKANIDNNKNIYEQDKLFHEVLAMASKNFALVKLIKSIEILLDSKRFAFLETQERAIESYNHHKKIFEAIKKQDKDLAKKCMLIHLKNVKEAIKISIEQGDEK